MKGAGRGRYGKWLSVKCGTLRSGQQQMDLKAERWRRPCYHAATLLSNGKVLSRALAITAFICYCRLYDPGNRELDGNWCAEALLAFGRRQFC